ncbi:copper transporter [Candidatus Formimonas warabiya]|uniref:Copper transporter n=1 Tax=Formimonas warabiya TaxID=1761012 RepID=A0A3G1KMV3_FORW1|nr:copper transporter [Candidatus Formimonas warabiya]ATW23783.1 hypothetical protein DCMF_02330 [Candidatus Formimonas warabiya]
MIDYKYHVTALVAIFLALGIGILIGSMIIGDEFVGNQQKLLIDRLEIDFQQMRVQNGLTKGQLAAANETMEIYQKFCQQIMPVLIQDKLQSYRVVVVQTNSSCNLNDIINPLKISGAEIEAVISVLNDFSLAKVTADSLSPAHDQGSQLMKMMGESILFGDDQGTISDLVKKKMIKISGTTGEPVDAVILAGGSQTNLGEQAKWLDLALSDYILENEVMVVGVEASTAAYSYMPYYQSKPMVTIDNIESIPGQISLVYSILGEKGNFGIKKTAKKLMPDLW